MAERKTLVVTGASEPRINSFTKDKENAKKKVKIHSHNTLHNN